MLLTLDLATNLGWTKGPTGARQFRSGSHYLGRALPLADFAAVYDEWLLAMLDGVTCVVMEAPILPRNARLETVRKLHGLAYGTELRCRQAGIDCLEASNTQVKQFMGTHRARRGEAKAEMLAAVRRMGFTPVDDDEADAIALRLYTIARLFPNDARQHDLGLGPLGVAALSTVS